MVIASGVDAQSTMLGPAPAGRLVERRATLESDLTGAANTGNQSPRVVKMRAWWWAARRLLRAKRAEILQSFLDHSSSITRHSSASVTRRQRANLAAAIGSLCG
jgi:hypothetical protein